MQVVFVGNKSNADVSNLEWKITYNTNMVSIFFLNLEIILKCHFIDTFNMKLPNKYALNRRND